MDQIKARWVRKEIDYSALARHWDRKCTEFYMDPENVRACEEWKRMRAEGRMEEAEEFLQEFYRKKDLKRKGIQ